MCKVNKIPSENRNFFKEKRYATAMNNQTILLESLNLSNRDFGGRKRENRKLTNLQVFQILVMMQFFAVKGFSHYATSVMNRMFGERRTSCTRSCHRTASTCAISYTALRYR